MRYMLLLLFVFGCSQAPVEQLMGECFPDGIQDDSFAVIEEEYKALAGKYNDSYDCKIDEYIQYYDEIKALAYVQGEVFLYCSYSNMDMDEAAVREIYDKGDFVTDEFSHGPILTVTQLIREDGTLIKTMDQLRDIMLPMETAEEALVYAHFATDGILSGTVDEMEENPIEPFTPCAQQVDGGWKVTMRSDMHSGGCQPVELDKLTYLIKDSGEVELLDRENLYTGEHTLCVD